MTKKLRQFNSCTILRTMKVETYSFDLVTGERTKLSEAIETRCCNVPLFSKDFREDGVCSSCQKGWEVEGNVFASEAERKLAMAAKA